MFIILDVEHMYLLNIFLTYQNKESNMYPRTCDHKKIGSYYLLAAFLFGISASILSVLMRLELDSSGNRIITIDILLILGYVTSGAPKYIGINILPNPPNNPGITKKKIISNPWRVILRL